MRAVDRPPDGLPNSTLTIACAFAVFVASIGLYAWTLAPTVTLIDSGELILAARTLGVAHPPGFPLYVLLAHLATLVPMGTIAGRVNFASALFAALASSVMTLVAAEALSVRPIPIPISKSRSKTDRGRRDTKPNNNRPPSSDESATRGRFLWVVPCLVSGFSLAFSRTLWGYATIAEVYTLNSLLILIVFLLMFTWRRGMLDARGRLDVSHRALYAAAFVFGLALGVHHVSVGLMLPALAVLVGATEGWSFFTSRRLIYAALFACAGSSVYAYLPLAAARSPIMNWGDPRTLERLWWHVTGKQYQAFLTFSLQTASRQFGEFVTIAAREFGPPWLPAVPALAIAGLIAVYRRNKTMFWFLALVVATDLAYSLGYEIAEDKDAYYLPAFVAVAIAAGFGVKWVLEMRSAARGVTAYVAAACMLAPLIALAWNLPYNNRSRYFIAADYVDNMLSTIEPRGMLLTTDWQVYSPMLYTREIEHRRDDVIVIDINLLRRSWYYDYLGRAYPATMAQAHEKVDAFLEDLRHWDHDPDLFRRDPALSQRINSRFYDMIMAFVANHIRSAPVYATLDIAANRDGVDAPLTSSLAASYGFVPQGLIFQVSPGNRVQPSAPQLVTRGLNDGTIRFEDDDVVKLKVLPVYVRMLYTRGRQLAAIGRRESAIESYKQALALDPGYSLARQAIDESATPARTGK